MQQSITNCAQSAQNFFLGGGNYCPWGGISPTFTYTHTPTPKSLGNYVNIFQIPPFLEDHPV